MANPEHLRILKQGVAAWNRWRVENPLIIPDLERANLGEAPPRESYFRERLLAEGTLHGADLHSANLAWANLTWTDLRGADLGGADLQGAIFVWADLATANLNCANLNSSDFTNATVGSSVFGDNDLSTVKGLESVRHSGPSTIGIDTIYKSKGNIPEAFLRGCGVPEDFITYMKSLVGKAIDLYSCFISYSTQDDEFAQRLYADLQAKNVRCWKFDENAKWGEPVWGCAT